MRIGARSTSHLDSSRAARRESRDGSYSFQAAQIARDRAYIDRWDPIREPRSYETLSFLGTAAGLLVGGVSLAVAVGSGGLATPALVGMIAGFATAGASVLGGLIGAERHRRKTRENEEQRAMGYSERYARAQKNEDAASKRAARHSSSGHSGSSDYDATTDLGWWFTMGTMFGGSDTCSHSHSDWSSADVSGGHDTSVSCDTGCDTSSFSCD